MFVELYDSLYVVAVVLHTSPHPITLHVINSYNHVCCCNCVREVHL